MVRTFFAALLVVFLALVLVNWRELPVLVIWLREQLVAESLAQFVAAIFSQLSPAPLGLVQEE